MGLHPASFYVHALRPRLSAGALAPATSRLLWLPVHLGIIITATLAIAHHWLPRPTVPLLSLVIGASFAGLMFLGHELLHGGVMRGHKGLQELIGWLCFAPFTLSPKLWIAWHNRTHHAHTNQADIDPDMYPTLTRYHANSAARFSIDNFAIGGHRFRGAFSLLVGFVVQSKQQLLTGREQNGMSRELHRAAWVETLLAVALWAVVGVLVGPLAFLAVFVAPLVVADIIVMAYILTNHGLSPGTGVNDPLVNSMSVSGPGWLEWLTLGFGYHVEHHVFPGLSARHGGEIRELIRETWPERYHTMGLLPALREMHRTGRVYKDDTTLADPRTGGEWLALAPRDRV